MRSTGKSESCGRRVETSVSSGPISGRRKMSESNTPNTPNSNPQNPVISTQQGFSEKNVDDLVARVLQKLRISSKTDIDNLGKYIYNLTQRAQSLSNETKDCNQKLNELFGEKGKITKKIEALKPGNSIYIVKKYWPLIIALGAVSPILIILHFAVSRFTNPDFSSIDTNTKTANNSLTLLSSTVADIKNTTKKLDKVEKIDKSLESLNANVTNFINTPKQPTGKDAMVQIDPNIATQLVALKTELSQLKSSIPIDISSKLEQLSKSVNNMSSAPAAPATPATTVSKPTNIEFDAKKLKDALKTEFGILTSNQSNLSTKIDSVSSSVSGNMGQMKADLDKINKIIGAQQEAKKEPKYQPVFLVVLSKGFKPQRNAIGSILQKLATPLPDSASKIPPTILVTADGNRQNVLSMAGYNQLTITTWLDNNDLREIKVPFDFLPTIINDKAGNSGQPKHVVILAGHNYQLDKTKDLSAWDKIEKITFVFVEPPFLSNLLWENFQKIQGLRRLKNLQTDVRIIKSLKDFDANFNLEVDEVDDITRVMKAALAD